MEKIIEMAISDQYKALSIAEKRTFTLTIVNEGIMSLNSIYRKMREDGFTVLEKRYVNDLLSKIRDARSN